MSDTDSYFSSSEESYDEKDFALHRVDYPTTERVLSEVPHPPCKPLAHEECFDNEEFPNVSVIKEWLRQEGKLLKKDIMSIVERATEIFREEPNMIDLQAPVTSK